MQQIEINSPALESIGAIADSHGVEIYAVGGIVRDHLLRRKTQDIDIAVVGDGIAFAQLLAEKLPTSSVFKYENFGTAGFILDGQKIEFVGTRIERYQEDSRKPVVSVGTIEDDLRRRDFTVNAIAASLNRPNFGLLRDPFNGQEDLRRKLLVTPLDPQLTFSDDPLRMMRAFRFSAQLGFTIDRAAIDAVKAMNDRISIVSMERIRDELLKLLAASKPSVGLAPMEETGLMAHVFPELHELRGVDQRSIEYPDGIRNFHHKDVFYHTLKVLDNLAEASDNLWLRLSALLHDIAKPRTKAFHEGTGWTFHGHPEIGARMIRQIFRHLRLPLEHLGYVKKMVLLHLRPIALINEQVTDSAVRRLLFDAGEDLEDLLMLCRSDITSKNPKLVKRYLQNYDALTAMMVKVEQRDRLRNWQPPLDGERIMQICGIKPGLAVGVLKSRIENAVLDGDIPNSEEAALEYLLSIKEEVLNKPLGKKPESRKKTLNTLPDNLKK